MAKAHPDRLFYAYTKSLKYWNQFADMLTDVDNFVLTASRGGRDDDMIDRDNLRESVVVFSEEEAMTAMQLCQNGGTLALLCWFMECSRKEVKPPRH